MKKIVLKLDLNDDKDKQKAMKAVASLQGIDSIGMDMKERKMTVIGSVDPVSIVSKLRKLWHTNVVSIGPAKEEKKDEEPKEEPQKEEPKKEEGKEEAEEENKEEKEEETKKEENKEEAKEEKIEEPNKKEKKEPQVQMMQEFGNPYKTYYYNPYMTYNPYVNYYSNNNPYPASQYYYVQSAQENTNSCHIL